MKSNITYKIDMRINIKYILYILHNDDRTKNNPLPYGNK
jgi:hypothetical protein